MSDYTFSVIIPTLDREEKLLECTKRLSEQTRQPEEVIIVDDGDLDIGVQTKIRETLGGTELRITSSDGPPGTSTARNTGIRTASSNIIVTLDDDVWLGAEHLERLEHLYEQYDSDTLAGIGVAGRTDSLTSTRRRLVDIHNRIFYRINSGWRINSAGFQKASIVSEPAESEWISGGVASYKRAVLLDHPFRHWEGGREVHEDIEICWRLKNEGYHFIVDPELPTNHSKGERHESGLKTGMKKGRNRVRMFRENGRLRHLPLFVWGCIGLIIAHLVHPFISESEGRYRFIAGIGVILGVIQQFPSIFYHSAKSSE
ncbi:glycosyltransferase [Halapricum sp. CBA1109]|uniref:glycosyltransferase family 2 protein n=1 Tax=Halapricum sp. CBA1109 TaxID=2668068 RepID=UPI0012F882B7|nr:glycosyltransferase family 2 protein [Halapricum sp. CBA1109]MUV88827.1 glycosyltransferase [Halapricum sp. CBA1109]